MGAAGAERVRREFSMGAMIGRYEALYERVARAEAYVGAAQTNR
jgi:glycosyltransferase involved in cell wall biosynthesis